MPASLKGEEHEMCKIFWKDIPGEQQRIKATKQEGQMRSREVKLGIVGLGRDLVQLSLIWKISILGGNSCAC